MPPPSWYLDEGESLNMEETKMSTIQVTTGGFDAFAPAVISRINDEMRSRSWDAAELARRAGLPREDYGETLDDVRDLLMAPTNAKLGMHHIDQFAYAVGVNAADLVRDVINAMQMTEEAAERTRPTTLTIDAERFDSLRREQGLDTIKSLADALGIDKGTASRVLEGKSAPGPKFISSVLTTFPVKFEDVFTVVDDLAEGADR